MLIFLDAYFRRGLLLEGDFAFENWLGLTIKTALNTTKIA